MKKRVILTVFVTVLFLAVVFVPVPGRAYDDGGTRAYTALTYKIVRWNRLNADGVYNATKVYRFPDNFKSIDELWAYEEPYIIRRFAATVLELNGATALVQPLEGEEECRSADKIHLGIAELEDIGAEAGSVVVISYTGGIMESYPAQIHAVKWEPATTLRHMEFNQPWLNKETAEKYDNDIFDHIVITKIYSNCFFAETVIPMPYTIKLNGTLSEEWCVGDQVLCTYENTYYDSETNRAEVDFLTVEASDWAPQPGMAYKPVIYLYPEEVQDISVKLRLDGKLTCTYPAYNNGWQVSATPDGTLTDAKGQTYSYLYWEGQTAAPWDMETGFCIKGEDTAAFLEEALKKLGLNRREANEFIVYWLPLMEQNPYNLISFQTDTYTDAAGLQIDPAPDTLIRVFMAWKAVDVPVILPEQPLTAPRRTGFTAVEWGGAEVK